MRASLHSLFTKFFFEFYVSQRAYKISLSVAPRLEQRSIASFFLYVVYIVNRKIVPVPLNLKKESEIRSFSEVIQATTRRKGAQKRRAERTRYILPLQYSYVVILWLYYIELGVHAMENLSGR